MRAEEQRQEARGQKPKPKGQRNKRRGRIKTQDKIAQARRTERVFPEGVDPAQCRLSHVRVVWRLEERRAVRIAYEIYRGPDQRYGKIPGVKTGRGARRQTIVTSVLESLRLYLPTFTLGSVTAELQRWWATGQSCFGELLQQLGLSVPVADKPLLDRLMPQTLPTG